MCTLVRCVYSLVYAYLATLSVAGHPTGGGDVPGGSVSGVGDGVLPPPANTLTKPVVLVGVSECLNRFSAPLFAVYRQVSLGELLVACACIKF